MFQQLSKMRFAFVVPTRYTVGALLFFLTSSIPIQAQVVLNAYAKVTTITSGNTVLAVSNVNEVNHTFTVGQEVIVMQMQDDVIGANTGNNNSFGTLSAIANTGNYEVRIITSKTPASGTPTSITLNGALTYTYNTGANASVQLVTFRSLGVNYTTTAAITGLAWDGNIGGVIALQVSNDLTLNHSITANGIGFRGGSRSVDNNGSVCASGNQNVFISNSTNFGAKGEGIYKNTNANYNAARGRLLTGGGGGAHHNGGGGGGGNYTQGGQGGNGYNNCTAFPVGGLGGIALASNISASRLFMGGGGGGGQQNNTVGSSGGNGGGIILLKANRILSTTTCPIAISITSNGVTAANSGNDGSGGGGAGGTILFQVNLFSINSACPIATGANGGNGGNVNDGGAHAGGGGGGQGAIIFLTPVPTVNITVVTNNGLPGVDQNSGQITATSGSGTNNSGILTAGASPLPIELLYFKGNCNAANGVTFTWSTGTEYDNDYFALERLSASGVWETATVIDGAGNSNRPLIYTYTDLAAQAGTTYYRLRQVDFNGQFVLYAPVAQNCAEAPTSVSLYPNPTASLFTIQSGERIEFIEIYDNAGRMLRQTGNSGNERQQTIDITDFPAACYTVRVHSAGKINYFKLLKIN